MVGWYVRHDTNAHTTGQRTVWLVQDDEQSTPEINSGGRHKPFRLLL